MAQQVQRHHRGFARVDFQEHGWAPLGSACNTPAVAIFVADTNVVVTTATSGMVYTSQLLQHHSGDSVANDDVSSTEFIRQDSLIIWLLNKWILKICTDSILYQVCHVLSGMDDTKQANYLNI